MSSGESKDEKGFFGHAWDLVVAVAHAFLNPRTPPPPGMMGPPGAPGNPPYGFGDPRNPPGPPGNPPYGFGDPRNPPGPPGPGGW